MHQVWLISPTVALGFLGSTSLYIEPGHPHNCISLELNLRIASFLILSFSLSKSPLSNSLLRCGWFIEFVNNNKEILLPCGVKYSVCGMQTIIGGNHKTLKHELDFLESFIELCMYELHDCTKANVNFAIGQLDPNMLQDIFKCPNNLDVFEGQQCESNTLVMLWCHYVYEVFDLLEQCAYWRL